MNLRTLLHMKDFPENWIFKIDKILAVFCFFFYWIDICDMLITSTIHVQVNKENSAENNNISKEKEEELESEEEKALENAKKQISEYTKNDEFGFSNINVKHKNTPNTNKTLPNIVSPQTLDKLPKILP